MLATLIEDFIVFENVDPNRVYLLGYSAGGDGVYKLAPRMADRFAAALMCAGHPNGESVLGLRNLPFAIHCGSRDSAYNRNKVAAEYGEQLKVLHQKDPKGYENQLCLPETEHWMHLNEVKVAFPFLESKKRNPTPDKVVWKQSDGCLYNDFYWLHNKNPSKDQLVSCEYSGQTFKFSSEIPEGLIVRVDDRMMNLNDEIIVLDKDGEEVFRGHVQRTIKSLIKTCRGDPHLMYWGEIQLK